MILDSAKGEFRAVLVWKANRFSRMDSFKAAKDKDALRGNGVYLHSMHEGKHDWESFTGRMIDVLHTETAHAASLTLSSDTISGRLDLLSQGNWPNGAVPYGYDRLYKGNGLEHLVKRNEQFTKPRNWERLLVVNQGEVKIVRLIFELYLQKDVSLRGIAATLNAAGTPRPDGSTTAGWTKDAVKAILGNKAYAGYAHIGGQARPLRQTVAYNRVGLHEKKDAIPAIVSEVQWAAATAKLQGVRTGTLPVTHHGKSSVLSGVLVCGHCGYRLDKKTRNNGKGVPYTYFVCASPFKRPGMGCHQWRVTEEVILPLVLDHLVKAIDATVLEKLDINAQEPDERPDLADLGNRLKSLQAQVNAPTT